MKVRGMARIVAVVRPALRASVEMGGEMYGSMVEVGLEHGLGAFRESLAHLDPPLDPADEQTLSRSLRRTLLAGVLDVTATEAEMAAELDLILTAALQRLRDPAFSR
jgi:hypothetical protein